MAADQQLSPTVHHAAGGDKAMVLETFTWTKEMDRGKRCEDFPVLVRAMAPSRRTERSRRGVDLVVVANVGGTSSKDDMIELMLAVTECLGPNDRLSLRKPTGFTELMKQDGKNWRSLINMLSFESICVNTILPLAHQVLEEREAEDSNNRQGCIFLLSAGAHPIDLRGQRLQEQMKAWSPVHTFLFGRDGADIMHHIAEKTSGEDYFIEDTKDMEYLKRALRQSIDRLTSVAVGSGTQINLETYEDVSILSIESGGYQSTISTDRRSGTIKIDDPIYACEEKNFIVHLTVPEGKQKLMTVGGQYRNPEVMIGGEGGPFVLLDQRLVSVLRRPLICPHVAAELTRCRLVEAISGMVGNPCKDLLQMLWRDIKNTDEGRSAPESFLLQLDKEVTMMQQFIMPKEECWMMHSWLKSHKLQRATTMCLAN